MPHASEQLPNGTHATTNGEKPNSQFLYHLISYPIVNDSIKAYKSTTPGAFSFRIVDSASSSIYTLEPYARTPISYVKPYISAADQFGNSSLDSFDSHFPLITKDTNTVKNTVISYASAPVVVPLRWTKEGRGYVEKVYDREWQNLNKSQPKANGVVKFGQAVVGTGLTVVGDVVGWAHEWVVKGEKEAGLRVKQVEDKVLEAAEIAKEKTQQKKSDVVSEAKEKKGEAVAQTKEKKGSAIAEVKEKKENGTVGHPTAAKAA